MTSIRRRTLHQTGSKRAGSSGIRTLKAFTVVFLLAVSVVIVPSAGAIPEQKSYTADVSPHAVGAGQTIDFTLTVVNTSGSQQLGSINLTAPSSFSLISTGQPSPAGTAAKVGNTGGRIELRNLALMPAGTMPAGTMTVTFRAEVPCSSGNNPWTIIAKQSNDFSGRPGNNFTLASSNLVTEVSGKCSIQWLTQPSDAKTNTAITSLSYDAALPPTDGPFIQAEVRSASYGNTTSRVTFSSDQISLDIGDDPSGGIAVIDATPPTALTVPAANGVATFTSGPEIDLHGLDYTLLAGNSIMVAGESVEFDVSDAVCEAPCTTEPVRRGGTRGQVTSDSSDGIVALSIGVLSELTCPGYTPPPNQQVVTVLPLGVSSTSTLNIEITLDAATVDRPASQLLVCFASTEQFTGRDGTQADPVTIAGDPFFIDVLPDCDRRAPAPPCQRPTTRNNSTGEVTLHILAPGDDPHSR